jgi:hypothetical protein
MIDRASDADDFEPNVAAETASPSSSNTRRFAIFTLAGLAAGLLAVLLVMRQVNYDPTPSLTPEIFHAAHEHWKSHKIPSYDIEVKVTGPQAATYRVEVRGGDAVAAWRNGQPLMQHRTFGTWSIPGMFSTISRDIEAIEKAAANRQQRPLILRAEFHPQFGYPDHYRRIDNGSRKGSDSITVSWDVTEFRVVDDAAAIEVR